jgi:hypothetical protein
MISIYSITRDKPELLKKSFKALREKSGISYRHYVVDNGDNEEIHEFLLQEKAKGNIHWLYIAGENLGQNLAANLMLDQIMEEEPDWILRWDPDAMPRTRRFLKKLVRCAERFQRAGVDAILSPRITLLENPPEAFMAGNDIGFEYEVVKMLGGICRLHPSKMFRVWRFNKFGALGMGEAAEISDRALRNNMPKLRITDLEVEHMLGHSGQKEAYPEDFTWEKREVGRYLGYGL